MNLEKLTEQLIFHEGIRLKPYPDSVGKLTIGVGRNLSDVGISKTEALYLLSHDISNAITDCRNLFEKFDYIPEVKQLVIADMMFNMGINRLKKFKRFRKAIESGNWNMAAEEMKNSKWFSQVGSRAVRLYEMMRDA